jgi:predicted acyl esterase
MARTSRKMLAAGYAAVLSAALALVPSGASDASVASGGSGGFQGYTVVSPLTFTVQVGPTNATTCTVDADLYVPASASPTNRVPAIIATNGFGGSKADQAGLGQAFAARGYAFLSYTGLGFPNSGCKIYLDDPAFDGKAASQLISFLGGSVAANNGYRVNFVKKDVGDHKGIPRSDDPRVGMIGGSYGGQIQFAVASIDARVDTIVPIITWNDLQYSLAPNNTSFSRGVTPATPGVDKMIWSDLFFGTGIVDGLAGVQLDPTRMVGCPNFRDEACAAKLQLDALGYPLPETVDLTKQTSVAYYANQITIPTLLMQGQADTLFNLQEAVATYRQLKAQRTPVKMIWQSWGHSASTPAPGEIDLSGGNVENTYEGARVANWFAYYLKDDRTAATGPEFAYFRPWVSYTGSAAPAYGGASSYPGGTSRTYLLSGGNLLGGGSLVTSANDVVAGSTSWVNPSTVPGSYSEVSALQSMISGPVALDPFDTPGTFGGWSSPALTAPLDIVGMPTLDVQFSAPTVALTQLAGPAGQLQVFAKLYDVGPDGKLALVNRLISPVRVADVTKPVHIELPGIVHQVPVGHHLQLVLASTDGAYRNATTVQPVSVTVDPANPPRLTVPIG